MKNSQIGTELNFENPCFATIFKKNEKMDKKVLKRRNKFGITEFKNKSF